MRSVVVRTVVRGTLAALVIAASALVTSSYAQRDDATVRPAEGGSLAPWLAGFIVQISDDAEANGAQAIPDSVRAAFDGYFPDALLDSVRWQVDGTSTLSAMRMFGNESLQAVTLNNVIVFVSDENASDLTLWAHELFHVMQYRDWGVEAFVARYLADSPGIERDAKEFRWHWMKATGRAPVAP